VLIPKEIAMRSPACGRSFLLDLVLVAAAAGLSAAPAAAQRTVDIDVVDFDFVDPNTGQHLDPTITVGDTVRWTFRAPFHTTTSATGQAESWDSGIRDVGQTFSHRFTNVGTFSYVCAVHSFNMQGQVIVQPVPEPHLILALAAAAGGVAAAARRRGRRKEGPAARGAFSALELLVVLAIAGVVFGLFMPAVQKVRESANYTSCRNNLKQLALATHQYEATHEYYPGVGAPPRQSSVLVSLLPFVELAPLARQIDPDRPLFAPRGDSGWLDPSQAGPARTVVRRFLCPADGRAPLSTGPEGATVAGTNYVANAGTGTGTYYDFRYRTEGVFWYGGRLRRAEIVDGISSTMFYSEALLGTGVDVIDRARVDPRRQWVSTGCMTLPAADRPGTNPPLTDETCMMTMFGMIWRGDRGASWLGGAGQRTLFNTYLMPNDPMTDCGAGGLGRFKASSNHRGGVNMVLGDGSVHFVKNHIELETWRALSTRADGEAVPSYCGCR
jgi:plastocyanin/type II secretory pathway pseudopilin PulG